MPTGIRYRRARARLRVTPWVIPILYAVGAIRTAAIVLRWDQAYTVPNGPGERGPYHPGPGPRAAK